MTRRARTIHYKTLEEFREAIRKSETEFQRFAERYKGGRQEGKSEKARAWREMAERILYGKVYFHEAGPGGLCQCPHCRSKSDTVARQPYDLDLTATEITPERPALPAPEDITMDERARVEKALAGKVICTTCGATLLTMNDACSVPLDVLCDGFVSIELAMYPDGRNLPANAPADQVARCRAIVEGKP